MKAKVKIIESLGTMRKTEKGYMGEYLVGDITGAKSVIKVFSKDPTKLVASGELLLEVNSFCFISE